MTRPEEVSRWCAPAAAIAASVLACASVALAHPISQGALDVQLRAGTISVTARVPVEQVMVASAAAAVGDGEVSRLEDLWVKHGAYLLAHLHLEADGRPLTGRVVKVVGTESVRAGSATYELEYPMPGRPLKLTLRHDVLAGLEYAPGNPWEATYITQLFCEGVPAGEGLPLMSGQERLLACGIAAGGWTLFGEYVRHGLSHIMGGYDHLLFITALALAAVTLKDLIVVVSAFTLAHSVTLVLSVLDIVRLPSNVVEPMIAASIVVVALCNVFWPRRSRGWVRLLTAFGFGLFHGLGFAGGLLDAMAASAGAAIGLSILGFSVGVELGHQLVVLPVFFGMRLVRAAGATVDGRGNLPLGLMRVGSLLVAAAGLFYLVGALGHSLL